MCQSRDNFPPTPPIKDTRKYTVILTAHFGSSWIMAATRTQRIQSLRSIALTLFPPQLLKHERNSECSSSPLQQGNNLTNPLPASSLPFSPHLVNSVTITTPSAPLALSSTFERFTFLKSHRFFLFKWAQVHVNHPNNQTQTASVPVSARSLTVLVPL